MPDFTKVVEFSSADGGIRHVVRRNDYMRLTHEDEHVYITRGRIETEDGVRVDPVPDWVTALLPQLNPEALAACGYVVPVAPEEPPEPPRRGRPPKAPTEEGDPESG